MKTNKIVTLTNRVALISILVLIYWVFVFTCITVFEFKIFRENITEAFYLSILGILALLGGAMIVNVMLNLTAISETLRGASDTSTVAATPQKSRKWGRLVFVLSFPLIFGLLYAGDLRTTPLRKHVLIDAAQYLLDEKQDILTQFVPYQFSATYIAAIQPGLRMLEKSDENFPTISILVADTIDREQVFLRFRRHYLDEDELENVEKLDYIYPCSKEERLYLQNVFGGQEIPYRFSAHDGFYELYYPIEVNAQKFVLYFTDRQEYGKYGS